jgi:glycosyltransferase involved in cell wall biosynthesis
LKITYILPVYWPSIGGCELHTHEIVKRLSEKHEIKVITQIARQEDKPNNLWFGTLVDPIPKRERYFDNKADVIPINMTPLERRFLYPFVRYRHRMERLSMRVISVIFQRKILDLMKDSNLIHCIHNGASFYAYTALKCARKLKVPFVFSPLLQPYQAWKDRTMAEKIQDVKWQKFIGIDTVSFTRCLTPRGYHDRFWFEVIRASDALITMTEFEKDFFAEKGIIDKKIHEVGVGPVISSEHSGENFRRKYNLNNKKMVLFLGRKHECKGIEEVLMAAPYVWKRHPDTYFFFIGPKEGNSVEIFKHYKDKRIIEVDRVDLEEKTSALEACDILCMPSFYEALGGVFLEAWMFGKPVIAGNIPPLRELTGDGQGGFLVNLDSSEIAEKIIKLIEDEKLCKKMGEWGRNKVVSKYSWDVIVGKLEEVYKEIVK